jgi:hypothetical protein
MYVEIKTIPSQNSETCIAKIENINLIFYISVTI